MCVVQPKQTSMSSSRWRQVDRMDQYQCALSLQDLLVDHASNLADAKRFKDLRIILVEPGGREAF